MSQFQIPRPTYTPSSISKASESIFQDIIDGSMSHLGASASTLQARIPPTYVSPSMIKIITRSIPCESSKVHENIFQDPIDGLMSQLGASTSTSNFLLPLPSASPSMYQLRAPSPTPQFQIHQLILLCSYPISTNYGEESNCTKTPKSASQFGHDASYGIQQQYSTPTLGNHENNQNRQDGVMSTFSSIQTWGRLMSSTLVLITIHPEFKCWRTFNFSKCFMAPRRARGASKALGKRPAQPSQDGEAEARRKARFDTGLFTSVDEYQRYKQHFVQRKVVAGRNINFAHLQHFGFESLFARMGWLPLVTISIFPTLVRAFYSRVTFGHGGPITSTVRGVQIHLDPESICRILDIPPGGLRVYDAKAWPTVPGFDPREAISGCAALQMPREAQTHSPIWPLHDTSVQGCGGGFEQGAGGSRGPAVMTHMMSSRCADELEKAPDGSWIRRADRSVPHPQAEEDEEEEIGEMEGGVDPQPDFEHREPEFDIPPRQSEGGHIDPTILDAVMTETGYTAGPSGQPSFTEPHYTHTSPGQAPDAAEHAPWMELSAQITSLGTRIEERMDQQQATHEHILQRLDRQERQHEELMAYLRAVFPPPPAAP
ncbi:hypothetical protein CK203_093608 [Vitis vinifera]|uniref:Uncharacterized protein n=1 Tax=Vitis vinifera TaxID=29760 RepID=A0A438DJT3_VITVI|nr:hypothetical protein CK203_093608 [Vitis vinifera]